VNIPVANAPCSWGALEFDWAGEAPPYGRVLDEMSATGYAGTELGDWGFLPTDPAKLADATAERNLALVGAFVPVALNVEGSLTPTIDRVLDVARLISTASSTSPVIVLADATAADRLRTRLAGRIQREHTVDERGWLRIATAAQTIARRVSDATGLRTAFHHHCATFVEAPWEIDELMARTDPRLLGLCLDTGHAAFGGGDPVSIADRWSTRIWHVHFKDCDPQIVSRSALEGWDYPAAVRHGVFCELGRGSVNFPALVDRLRRSHYQGWIVVEQDVLPSAGTPFDSAARNRRYLASLGL
jgi:inosose dehydratase